MKAVPLSDLGYDFEEESKSGEPIVLTKDGEIKFRVIPFNDRAAEEEAFGKLMGELEKGSNSAKTEPLHTTDALRREFVQKWQN